MPTLENPASPADVVGEDSLAVSVIIPTYRSSAEGLDRVVSSLDAQTLPTDRFEALFVDDGSPDDTVERLLALGETRGYVRVTSIPNSGWPSRPRNVGVRMARGEFVVFMDHDDILFPGALADATRFAREHALDALSAKEVKTSSRFFTWLAFQRDIGRPDHKVPLLLSPMTPHKMYRRQFLLDRGITFPEGRPDAGKVQWEDIHFNIDVYANTDSIGVLSSRPFYHWVVGHGSNSSSSYARDPDEYWQHLEEIFTHLDRSEMDEESADWIRASNYSNRVLQGMVGPGGLKRDLAYYARALELAQEFAKSRVPFRVDALLDPVKRPRSTLLRAGRTDLLRPLAESDQGMKAVPVATGVRFSDGRLIVSVAAVWTTAADTPLGLRRHEGRLLRVVPDEVAAVLSPDDLDVTDQAAEATVDLAAGGRESKLAWPLPTEGGASLSDQDDGIRVEVKATGVLDPRTAELGNPLGDDVWEIACRSTFAGFASHPLVQYDGPDLASFVDGRFVVAFASKSDRLLVDVGGRQRTVLRSTHPDVGAATLRRVKATSHRLEVPVLGAEVVGTGRLSLRVRLRSAAGRRVDLPAELIADRDGARLVAALARLERGRYRLLVDDRPTAGGRGQMRVTPFVVDVGRGGPLARMTLRQEPVRKPRRPVWQKR